MLKFLSCKPYEEYEFCIYEVNNQYLVTAFVLSAQLVNTKSVYQLIDIILEDAYVGTGLFKSYEDARLSINKAIRSLREEEN